MANAKRSESDQLAEDMAAAFEKAAAAGDHAGWRSCILKLARVFAVDLEERETLIGKIAALEEENARLTKLAAKDAA